MYTWFCISNNYLEGKNYFLAGNYLAEVRTNEVAELYLVEKKELKKILKIQSCGLKKKEHDIILWEIFPSNVTMQKLRMNNDGFHVSMDTGASPAAAFFFLSEVGETFVGTVFALIKFI